MQGVRSLQSLLARSRLLLLAGLVVSVFVAVGFLDLAMTQHAMSEEYQLELQRVERLREQNAVLQRELDRAQQNQHIPWLSWEYFGKVPKDTGVIEGPSEAPEILGPQLDERTLLEKLYERWR